MTEQIIDAWTWFDHKPSMKHNTRSNWLAPSWVGEHHRRLQAYRLLDSYYMNSAREWMDSDLEEADRNNRREYGDAQTVVNQIVTSLLGIDQSIVVGGDEKAQASSGARAQRDALHKWADDENFFLKLLEFERTAVKLGDAVYVLGIDADTSRPRLTVWDPGFYFPVMDPTVVTDEFSEKIHICYEYEDQEDDYSSRKYVRRITWELVELTDDDGNPLEREFPWRDDPTSRVCVMSDATWLVDDLKAEVTDFTYEKAKFADYEDPETGEIVPWDEVEIGFDFIPVVHIPNTPASSNHYGQSSIAPVIQVVDDLISTDTDLQAASATTGTPPLALAGSSAPKNDDGTIASYGPGTVLETGDGTATMIDTSRSLDALLKYDDHLLERLSVNGRVPESLLGRVKPNEVPSGIALTLSFAPHSSMIQEMRMVRDVKYRLLLKFVARMFRVLGDEAFEGEEYPIHLKFGTFLPADRKETVDLVVQLLSTSPPAISLETGVRMLVEAGFPIEDAAKEVERIIRSDFEGAENLLAATGDVAEVRKRLGMKPVEEQAQPAPGTNAPPPADQEEGIPPEGEPELEALPTPDPRQ